MTPRTGTVPGDLHPTAAEAVRLIQSAQLEGITLRLLGSTAVRYRCNTGADLFGALGRPAADIDLAGYGTSAARLPGFMSARGYETDLEALTLFGHERQMYDHRVTGVHVDLFLDRLRFCHEIDLRGRLELGAVTVPPADLVLSKIQIVDITEVDLQDLVILLAEHDAIAGSDDAVDTARVAGALAREWGFYYTAMRNLARLQTYAAASPLDPALRARVAAGVHRIREAAERAPKPFSWRMRAAIGPRFKWYVDVEDDVRR